MVGVDEVEIIEVTPDFAGGLKPCVNRDLVAVLEHGKDERDTSDCLVLFRHDNPQLLAFQALENTYSATATAR